MLNKGQQAMAMIYPECEKGGRGNKLSYKYESLTKTEENKISQARANIETEFRSQVPIQDSILN